MKQPWEKFTGVRSQSFVPELVKSARDVSPHELVDMQSYRKAELEDASGEDSPLSTFVAYAQEEYIYGSDGRPVKTDRVTYEATPRMGRLNVFGRAYRPDVPLYLNKILADITVGAAIHLYQTKGWRTVIYDGLRTVDGAFNLYNFASDKDIADGLLALPGQSAHNKGLAVDSMMVDDSEREVDMGGHFDHLDMGTNSRTYQGNKISETAKKNRLIREAAFLRSAFTQGLLVAPLRSEFWDDRPPENREDLWRVLDSSARCIGIRLLTPEDEALRKENRSAFRAKWESWSYTDFLAKWHVTFKGREAKLKEVLGITMPPITEKPEFYHGNYHPIYDDMLRASGKHLTDKRTPI